MKLHLDKDVFKQFINKISSETNISVDILEKAYSVKLENNSALLKGVVSRKKQVVPVMTENA